MTIKTILVSIDGTEEGAAPLEAALWLGHRLATHLDVLHVRPDSLTDMPAIGEAMPDQMTDRIHGHIEQGAEDRSAAARAQFEAALARHGGATQSTGWIERTGRRHKVLQRLGRVHDLVVVGPPSHDKDIAGSLVMDAIFETGRPVLVVPSNFRPPIARRIAIAWNGSPECARALGGASNFLPLAEEVVVLTAESKHTPISLVPDLESYLARHGVTFRSRVFAHMGRRPMGGKVLLEACAEEKADLLVMGAKRAKCWHWHDLILGHATKQVLRTSPIPVLMGH